MHKNKVRLCVLLVLCIISIVLIPITFSKYYSSYSRTITLSIAKPTYTIVFHSNTQQDTTSTQTFTYGTAQNLDLNTFTNGSSTFLNWNTAPDGSGTSYTDGQSVNNLSSVNNAQIDLYAQWSTGIAEINGVYYPTINDAVSAVPTTGVQTTINVLVDVELTSAQETITIPYGKNVVLNLQNHTISNQSGVHIPLIENYGKLQVTNGTLYTSATQGAVNNESTGEFYISDGTISATNTKQGIYNDGGYVEISGTANITSTSNQRAAVQNQAGGTMKILGGTISSTRFYGVQNAGTLIIGEKDGTVSKTSPSITGTYGIYATANFKFYDGIAIGKNEAINDLTKVNDVETGYELVSSFETQSGTTYKTKYLSDNPVTITFNANGGTVDEASRKIEAGVPIKKLPTATYSTYTMDGWFTSSSGGTLITTSSTFSQDTEIFAQYSQGEAEIDGTFYATLADAISALPNNTQTTIKLYANASVSVTIPARKNVILDLQGRTLSNSAQTPVITNNSKLVITNGTITSDATQGAINNNSAGTLEITNTTVSATGTRQALYNNGGTVTISSSTLTATTSERAAVHNLNNGTITILSGTVRGVNQNGVENASGTVILGAKDGTIDATTPVIIGKNYGVLNSSTFKFYDGIIKGVNASVSGTISEREDNSTDVDGAEVIDLETYLTKHLTL